MNNFEIDLKKATHELNRIKGNMDSNTGLLSVLKGIYHIRIEYPDELESNKATSND